MTSTFKQHFISAVLTFVIGFATYMGIYLSTPNFEFTKDAISAAALAGFIAGGRAVLKLIIEWNTEPQA